MKRAIWLAVLVAVAASLVAGSQRRDTGPRTIAQRTEAIAEEVRCPTCEGLSVAESSAPVSESIRSAITERLEDGDSDEEVKRYLVGRYGGDILLRPPSRGIGALVWIGPVVALAVAAAFLALTFRRWRGAAPALPDDESRRLVERELQA